LYGDPVLRRTAVPVERFDEDLRQLAGDMIETMHDAHGVGLAAPQIGVARRLFVAVELADAEGEEDDDFSGQAPRSGVGDALDDAAGDDAADDGPEVVAVHVMVNPEILRRAGLQIAPDGCLSVPGLWVEEMERDAEVVVRYQDLDGAEHERLARGHFAHVIQHELDHLDGVLYFDRLDADARRAFLEAHRSELADLQRRAKALLKELRAAGAAAS
jgi:peptide deformylase